MVVVMVARALIFFVFFFFLFNRFSVVNVRKRKTFSIRASASGGVVRTGNDVQNESGSAGTST